MEDDETGVVSPAEAKAALGLGPDMSTLEPMARPEVASASEVAEALGMGVLDEPVPTGPSYTMTLAAARPMLDRLLAQLIPDPVFSKGGLHIPQQARDRPLQALVVAVGPGKALDNGRWLPMGVKVGDVILFQKFGGSEVRIDGETYKMLRQDEIMCVFEQPLPTDEKQE